MGRVGASLDLAIARLSSGRGLIEGNNGDRRWSKGIESGVGFDRHEKAYV